jgi:hypothetical protein
LFAFEILSNDAFSLFTDSQYLYQVLCTIETALISHTADEELFHLFLWLQAFIHHCSAPCFVGHLHAHTNLPGPLTQGNAITDAATQQVFVLQQAQDFHVLHHQNADVLKKQFGLSREAACQIVRSCTSCPQDFSVPTFGIYPRGLLPGHLWQMDVIHIPEFGRLQFVHVIINTFSHFLVATAQTGEAVKDFVAHCLHAFSILKIPKYIKTDNVPACTSKSFFSFCLHFGINLKTGIPYNPQG